MTPAQAKAVVEVILLRLSGLGIVGADGLPDDLGEVTVRTPAGGFVSLQVALPGPLPLPRAVLIALAAEVQRQVRYALAGFETDAGRGFNDAGRGSLQPGEPGAHAVEGWQ